VKLASTSEMDDYHKSLQTKASLSSENFYSQLFRTMETAMNIQLNSSNIFLNLDLHSVAVNALYWIVFILHVLLAISFSHFTRLIVPDTRDIKLINKYVCMNEVYYWL